MQVYAETDLGLTGVLGARMPSRVAPCAPGNPHRVPSSSFAECSAAQAAVASATVCVLCPAAGLPLLSCQTLPGSHSPEFLLSLCSAAHCHAYTWPGDLGQWAQPRQTLAVICHCGPSRPSARCLLQGLLGCPVAKGPPRPPGCCRKPFLPPVSPETNTRATSSPGLPGRQVFRHTGETEA